MIKCKYNPIILIDKSINIIKWFKNTMYVSLAKYFLLMKSSHSSVDVSNFFNYFSQFPFFVEIAFRSPILNTNLLLLVYFRYSLGLYFKLIKT